MPTLNESTGELEGGSVAAKKPSGLHAALNRAGVILSIIGATLVATDAKGQQVATATIPQQPGQGGPVTPGNGESTTEAPTAEMIIQILRDQKAVIKGKFSTCTDAALAKMAGEIALGTIDPKKLEAVAGAFKVGSDEAKAIMAYAKFVENTPKPAPTLASPVDAGAKKLPPLNETKEQKETRIAKERQIKKVNEGLMSKDSWIVDKDKTGDVKVTEKGGVITLELKPKDKKASNSVGTVNANFQLQPGKYILDVNTTGVPPVIYLYDGTGERIDESGKIEKSKIALKNGKNIFSLPENCANFSLSASLYSVTNQLTTTFTKLIIAPLTADSDKVVIAGQN